MANDKQVEEALGKLNRAICINRFFHQCDAEAYLDDNVAKKILNELVAAKQGKR